MPNQNLYYYRNNFQNRSTAFGSVMQTRSYIATSYRFGFNNQEKDGELGEAYAFEYRIHDARLGRFLRVDPLSPKFPWYSPYHFGSNSPIMAIELEGLESSSTGTNGTENTGNVKSASYCDGSNLGGYLDILGNDIILPPAATAIVNVYAHFTLTCSGKSDIDKGDHPIVKSFNDGEGHTYNWSQTKNNYESECGDIFPKVSPLDPNASNQGQSMQIWQDGSENSVEQKYNSTWWEDGYSDPVNTGCDVSGFVLQASFSFIGNGGSIFFGFSKYDGLNAGISLHYGFEPSKTSCGLSVLAASGEFTWKNFAGPGSGYSGGFGPISYTYGRNQYWQDIRKGERPTFQLQGLTFGSPSLKPCGSINNSTTWLFFGK